MTQNLEKKNALEEKIQTYRYLFAHGIEEPTEKNVEDWLDYHRNKIQIGTVRGNARKKIELLRLVGLEERANKIQRVLEREYQPEEDYIEACVREDVASIREGMGRKFLRGSAEDKELRQRSQAIMNTLLEFYIYCEKRSTEIAIQFQYLRDEKTNMEIYGYRNYGPEVTFNNIFDLFRKAKRIRLGHFAGVETGFEIKGKRDRESYYKARSELRLQYRKNKMNKPL